MCGLCCCFSRLHKCVEVGICRALLEVPTGFREPNGLAARLTDRQTDSGGQGYGTQPKSGRFERRDSRGVGWLVLCVLSST